MSPQLTSPLLLEASCFFCLWKPFMAAEALGALKPFMFFAFCGFIARWNSILSMPQSSIINYTTSDNNQINRTMRYKRNASTHLLSGCWL
jgi:hypothetical protein